MDGRCVAYIGRNGRHHRSSSFRVEFTILELCNGRDHGNSSFRVVFVFTITIIKINPCVRKGNVGFWLMLRSHKDIYFNTSRWRWLYNKLSLQARHVWFRVLYLIIGTRYHRGTLIFACKQTCKHHPYFHTWQKAYVRKHLPDVWFNTSIT